MTKVCPRCHHMVREPAQSGALSCPRCLRQGNAVPLLNAIQAQAAGEGLERFGEASLA
jgi:hypothetical protein